MSLPDPAGPAIPAGVRTTRRRGRTSAAKETALRELSPRWAPDSDAAWSGPLLIDVGVGDGEATRAWATEEAMARVLAVELHRPGLAKLLAALEQSGPPNVRVTEADALEVLADLPDGSVHGIRVLFPDPWPKRRHVARRLVDRAFVATAARLLLPGGRLELATDWADYAEHMVTMVATDPRLQRRPEATPAARPVTAYERRGLAAGRTITDLVYERAAGPATP